MKDGQITGPSTEIVRQMFKRIGTPISIQLVTWARGYKEVQEKPNVALYSTTRSAQREKLFQWVGPISRSKDVFYAKKGSGIKIASLDDAKKVKAIGTYLNDAREQFLQEHGFSNLDSVFDNKMNPRKLVHNRIVLWISAENEGRLVAQDAGVDPAKLEAVYTVTESELYLAVSKQSDPSIVKKLQESLDSMHADGSFEKILKKWNVTW
jgi:polar amino acid transport system substrate-binding protein